MTAQIETIAVEKRRSLIALYHFTAPFYLPAILSDGRLKTTLSEINFPRAGEPRVVWLTDDPHKDARREKHPSSPNQRGVDKMGVRFTVRLPRTEATRWKWFARDHGATAQAMARLSRAANGTTSHWYVIERDVPRAEWVELTDTTTGRPISEAAWPAIVDLLPELREIQAHVYVGEHNVTMLPGAMKSRLDELARKVVELAGGGR